jgi:hypothetical protein
MFKWTKVLCDDYLLCGIPCLLSSSSSAEFHSLKTKYERMTEIYLVVFPHYVGTPGRANNMHKKGVWK